MSLSSISPAIEHSIRKSSIWLTRPNVAATFELVIFCPSICYWTNKLMAYIKLKFSQFSFFRTTLAISLIVTYFSVWGVFNGGQPGLGAFAISLWNFSLPLLCHWLVTRLETHYTTDSMENSFLAKTVAARCFCSSIIMFLIGIEHSTQVIPGPDVQLNYRSIINLIFFNSDSWALFYWNYSSCAPCRCKATFLTRK